MEQLLAQADPAVQAQIRTTVAAFSSGKQADMTTNWKGYRELTTLMGLAADKEQIVKQLAIYAVAEQRPEETQVLEAQLVLHFLDVKPRILIRSLAPYLNSGNKQLRDFAREWFEAHGSAAEWPLKAVNDKEYVNYVRDKIISNEEIPAGLVEYLYQSPERALLVFDRAYGQRDVVDKMQAIRKKVEAAKQGQEVALPKPPEREKEIPMAAHIVDNVIWLKTNGFVEQLQKALPEAKEQLATLAQHDQWWVRLYVAEIMRRHPELRVAEIVEKLSNDGNASVSKAAKAAKG